MRQLINIPWNGTPEHLDQVLRDGAALDPGTYFIVAPTAEQNRIAHHTTPRGRNYRVLNIVHRNGLRWAEVEWWYEGRRREREENLADYRRGPEGGLLGVTEWDFGNG